MNFNVRLKNLMEEQSISPKVLAIGIGKSKSFISQLLSGKTNASEKTLQDICEFLGCDSDYFSKEIEKPLGKNMKNVSVEVAAQMIGKPTHFVRVALQQGAAPFGFAVKNKRWSYHISRKKLLEYIGD